MPHFNLAGKHGITIIPVIILTHLNVEGNYLFQGRLVLQWHLLHHITQAAFHLWGQPKVDLLPSWHTNQWQLYLTLEIYLLWGALGLNAFNQHWIYEASYTFPPFALVPLVLYKFLAEKVTGQFRVFILLMPYWMEASWLPTFLSMLGDIPH